MARLGWEKRRKSRGLIMRSSVIKVFTLALLLVGLNVRVQAGYILQVFYDGIPGTAVSNLTSAPSFPNGPNPDGSPLQGEYLTNLFESWLSSGNGADNYGSMTRGYLEAPVTGDYTFWIASTDGSQLWLSTDVDSAKKRLIASVPDGGTTTVRQWTKYPSQKSALVSLVKGQKYYIEALLKAGVGTDHIEVGWQRPDGVLQQPMPALFLAPYPDPYLPDPSFVTQPKSVTNAENAAVTLFANINGSQTMSFQWLRNGIPVLGATLSSYTFITPMSENGAVYYLIAGNGRGLLISDPATVTVTPDTTPPKLNSFVADMFNPFQIKLVFSEPMDQASALNKANYSLGAAGTISSAVMGSDESTVLLKTTQLALNTPYTLSINNVRDQAATPNGMSTNVTFNIPALIPLKLYTGVSGGTTNLIFSSAKFQNGAYDQIIWTNVMDAWTLGDSYIGQFQAILTPPANGDYIFFICADDSGLLYLSSDDQPANKALIAYTAAYTSRYQYNKNTAQKSAPITLQGGKRYYIEALVKENTGGDGLAIAWQKPGDPALGNGTNAAITTANLSLLGTLGPVFIARQPTNVTALENGPATFSVVADGTPPYSYQWYQNNKAVSNATAAAFTLARAAFTNAQDKFFVVVNNQFSSATSSIAGLNLVMDTTPPVLVGAGSLITNTVSVVFDEAVQAASAGNKANYSLKRSDGAAVTVNSAALLTETTVQLLTADLVNGIDYSLTVQNVKDVSTAGNTITNSTATFKPHNFLATTFINPQNTLPYSAVAIGNKITMVGAGADVWGTADQCTFTYMLVTGNFDFSVRLESIEAANAWSKFGIMARSTLAGGSRQVGNFGTSSAGQNRITMQYRDTTDGASADAPTVQIVEQLPNNWIRMQRIGNVIYCYYSTDGIEWIQHNMRDTALSTEGPMPATLYVGLLTVSHDNGRTTTSIMSDFGIPPSVPFRLISQPQSTTVRQGSNITFQARVLGNPPYFFQWQRNGSNIVGATAATYTTAALTYSADNGAIYRCIISNLLGGLIITSEAVLTVPSDTNAPTVLSAAGNATFNKVTVTYSEPVDPATALVLTNYAVDGSLTLTNPQIDRGSNVVFTTPPQTPGKKYTITINRVADLVGYTITNNTKVSFTGWALVPGYVKFELFTGISGTTVASFTSNAKYTNNTPDQIKTFTIAEAWNQGDNYGARMSGLLSPPETGNYLFYISSDDDSQLFISTDANPANRGPLPIASVGGWAGQREWNKYATQKSAPISLVAGQQYYIEALLKEGTGGDGVSIGWLLPSQMAAGATNLTNNALGIAGQFFSMYFNPDLSFINITQQPTNVTVLETRTATFTVVATAGSQYSPTASYQWQLNSNNIAGATGSSYTTPVLTVADSGGKYRCVLTVPTLTNITTEVTLTVLPDTVPPVPIAAAGLVGNWQVNVFFDEKVDTATATNIANYGVLGGIVSDARMSRNGNAVLLTVDWLAGDTAQIMVKNIKDVVGNINTNAVVLVAPLSQLTARDVGTQNTNTYVFTNPLERGETIVLSVTDFDVIAGGTDIWDAADGFHFVYERKAGDFDLAVQVPRIDLANNWTKAGIMAREKMIAGSRNVCLVVDPNGTVQAPDNTGTGANRYEPNYRATEAGTSASWPNVVGNSGVSYPNVWLRLQRVGNTFIAYRSSNNVAWVQLSQITIADYPNVMYVGLATSAHNNNAGRTTYVQYRNYAAVPRVPLAVGAQPADASALQGQTVTFSAAAAGSPPYAYQWMRNGTAIAGATGANYTTPSLTYTNDNNAKFKCVISNLYGEVVTTREAVLTINPDFVMPAVLSVAGSKTLNEIIVSYSEAVNQTSATALGNYTASGGITLASATLSANLSNVVLKTSPQTSGTAYTLLIARVTDVAGNMMVPSTNTFTAWVLAKGFMMSELYANISGTTVASLTTNAAFIEGRPTSVTGYTGFFEVPSDGDNYGLKAYAILTPQVTGDYTFYIASDDDSALYISTDDNPANKGASPIATVNGWTNSREWKKYTNQTSAPVRLEAGKLYYLEALMKEGTGGDNLAVAWILPGQAGIANNALPMSSANYGLYVNPDHSTVQITQQPKNITVLQSRPATFTVAGTGSSDMGNALMYQWQKNDVIIPGAIGASYTLATPSLADSGAKFSCIVSVPAKSVTSTNATLTVTPDTVPPTIALAAGLLGNDEVFIYFSEVLDPVSASTRANYGVSGGVVADAVLSTDGKSVVLSVTGLSGTNVSVAANRVKDLAGNAMPQVQIVTAPVSQLTAQDVGTQDPNTLQYTNPLERGATWAFSATDFDVIAGGTDIWDAADGFHFTYERKAGDFDLVVQVPRIDLANNWTKAGIMAREKLTAGSRNVCLVVDPNGTVQAPDGSGTGANRYEPNYRATEGGSSASWPTVTGNSGVSYPDVWLRLQRVGNSFTAYRSSNNVDWLQLSQITIADYPNVMYVGLATSAHNNSAGRTTYVQYRNYGNYTPAPVRPANIAWVSFHAADNTPSPAAATAGFTNAADVGYTALLAAKGYNVTRYVTVADLQNNTNLIAALKTNDLIILSRSQPSGNFDTTNETAAWNGMAVPMIWMSGYLTRASRVGFNTGSTLPDVTNSPMRLNVNVPAHAIFAGVTLDAGGTMVNLYAQRVTITNNLQLGISVVTDGIIAGGTVLATVGTTGDPTFGGMVIGEFPKGITSQRGNVLAAKRLVFLSGSREAGITSECSGIYDLMPDGEKLFLNAVKYMTTVTP
jgi:hypothetical protein